MWEREDVLERKNKASDDVSREGEGTRGQRGGPVSSDREERPGGYQLPVPEDVPY